ncbi:MAG TPA: class I SAM-dependent methyltransferase [Streptosporangiaceae bacterium]|jgi:predicted O-methyltransferase YrrM
MSEDVPALVGRAIATARAEGFPLTRDQAGTGLPSASLPATGRFLAVLAAGCRGGRIAELGTGVGIGSAWMASAMPADCTLITTEIDSARAAAATVVLAADERVRVLTGDWAGLLPPLAPFDMIFADSGIRDQATFGHLVDMLRPGGRIVMDDLTPVAALAPDSPFRGRDPKRDLFSGEHRLVWTEVVLTGLRDSLLVGARVN